LRAGPFPLKIHNEGPLGPEPPAHISTIVVVVLIFPSRSLINEYLARMLAKNVGIVFGIQELYRPTEEPVDVE
jgi:hypothetical protein